uniref:Uncharacterized protein n=1 Tax=Meloidogyne enterolobii TaxID=390850 RepID=A0A6V7UJV6_MELEN|nr:unnamed protein product [Meloidogyne enterolobii]
MVVVFDSPSPSIASASIYPVVSPFIFATPQPNKQNCLSFGRRPFLHPFQSYPSQHFSPFKVGRLRFKNIAPLYFLASAM